MSVSQTTTGSALRRRVLNDPQLRDLPYKIETEKPDKIILRPRNARHGLQQGRLVQLLSAHLPDGRPAVEFAVETPRGVKVPDVVWISDALAAQLNIDAEASSIMPELVIEVLSRSNPQREMAEKVQLYLDGGAQEVWLCDVDGNLTFYDGTGEQAASSLVPSFPGILPS